MAEKFIVIAGPCLIESYDLFQNVARAMKQSVSPHHVELVLKGSFRKANRTSRASVETTGVNHALAAIQSTGFDFGVRTITDFHSVEEIQAYAQYVDCIQIPAFLCRQTDLIVAAGATGKVVNIKKGQFMAPEDMFHAVEKAHSGGASEVWLTERGTSFGYHDLVVDMRSLAVMREFGVPVIFDATHSTQRPSIGSVSGGDRKFALPLASAAAAVGIDGIFLETHPEPAKALSDQSTQLPFGEAARLIARVVAIHEFCRDYKFTEEKAS